MAVSDLRGGSAMRRPYVRLIALVCTGLIAVGANISGCPADAIGSSADLIATPLGSILVESCVSEAAGVYTYLYRITNLGITGVEICQLTVPGIGLFPGATMRGLLGWTGKLTEGSACATWWSWSSDAHMSLLPGESLETSLTIDGDTTPATLWGGLTLCDGTECRAEILAPSACAGVTRDSPGGCFCSDDTTPVCTETHVFEGSGTRIVLFGGRDRQVLAVCGESWIRQGFYVLGDVDRYAFDLYIDGRRVTVERRIMCLPVEHVAWGHLTAYWHIQFPAEHFEAGRLYELMGQWYVVGDDGSPERIIYTHTIELQVLPCLVPATSAPLEPALVELPDLIIEPVDEHCECGYTPQQVYECDLTVYARIINIGDAEADTFFLVQLEALGDTDTVLARPLSPGGSETYILNVSFPRPSGHAPYTLTVDSFDAIIEHDERNNEDEGSCDCD